MSAGNDTVQTHSFPDIRFGSVVFWGCGETGGFSSSGFWGIGMDGIEFGCCQVEAASDTLYQCCWNLTTAKPMECNAAKPDVGKAMGSSMPFPADATINQF